MDIASIIIHCNSDTIYKFMSDKKKINLWSFGIEWDLNKTEDNIIQGKSNYDESISYLRITKNDTKKNIYYWIGKDKLNLIPRIYVRITPKEIFNNGKTIFGNELSMISLKTDDINEERWTKLKELHQLEINVIKKLIEG